MMSYGESTPSISIPKNSDKFHCGCTSTSDAERFGYLIEFVKPEIIDKNPRYGVGRSELKVRGVMKAIGISYG